MLATQDSSSPNYFRALLSSGRAWDVHPRGIASRLKRGAFSSMPAREFAARTARTVSLVAMAVCALSMLGASIPANAQSLSFTSIQVTAGTGLTTPVGVAVDGLGNLYIADSGLKQVVKVPAGCTTLACQTTVGTGLTSPVGVAVDGLGDVFIVDNNARVLKVPASGFAQSAVGVGIADPVGVAADAVGDVFIVSQSANQVVKVPAGCANSGCQTTVGSGLLGPVAAAVNGAGDVFILDAGNARLVKVPAGGGAQTTVISSLSNLTGVTVDGAGNIFVVGPGFPQAGEVPVGCTMNSCGILVGSELNTPEAVTVDGTGDVFVADTNNHRVVKLQPVSASIGNINVCPNGQTTPVPCNQKLTLTYTAGTSGVTLAANPVVVTQGASNLDFTLSGTTCTGLQAATSLCSVDVLFAPRAPGLRMGAVRLSDSSGNALVTSYIHGIGQGPAIAFGPGMPSTVSVTLGSPQAVAVDAAGDLFAGDGDGGGVVKIPAGSTTQSAVSSVSSAGGLAIDGAGDLFVSDTGGNLVAKVSAATGAQTTVASGLSFQSQGGGLAVDGEGDLFIADTGNSRVLELPAGCTSSSCQKTVATGLSTARNVAVDGAGDLFIANGNAEAVVKIPAGCNVSACQTSVGVGLSFAQGVAVDGAGDLFIADLGGSLVEVPAGCNVSACQAAVSSGLNCPQSVALDAMGDVFIADPCSSPNSGVSARVVEVQRALPAAFSFATTTLFDLSADSPQSVTARNIGNQLLSAVAPGLTISTNSFVQVPGPGILPDCTTSFSLAPGAGCNLSVGFIPQVTGSLAAVVKFADNSLNSATATQALPVSGAGLIQIVSFGIDSVSPSSAPAGGPAFTMTVNGIGFINGATVNFNGSPRTTTFFSNTQLTASITAADIALAGWDKVTVSNPGASGAVSNAVTVQVISGSSSPSAGSALRFVPVTPCRLVDTRTTPNGAFAGPSIAGGTSRNFTIPQNTTCKIPSTAAAYSLNVAVIPAGALGFVTLWPAGQTRPVAATVSSADGRVRSNAAIVPAGSGGAISVFASNTTDLVLDINGYFTTATTALEFFPVTPCRLVDTRNANGTFGGPFITGNTSRTFPLPTGSCNLPATAQAYSLNLAVVPQVPLGFLTAWPTGQTQPGTANLSSTTGTVTASAAIVPAGTSGSINVFASNNTDLIIDVNGYFAPAAAGGFSLYTVAPCRALDTRQLSDSQTTQPFTGELDENLTSGACAVPAAAQAYVLNATVVPPASLGFLTLWPQATAQPSVATLSALDQTVTSNLAIVSTVTGSVSAFASNPTHLVLDLFGFFAP